MPVSEICETIFNLEIVNVSSSDLFAFLRADRRRLADLGLPARDFFRVLHVREIDHSHRAGCIVGEVNVVIIDERAMNAAGDSCRVFRDQFRMSRIGRIVKRDSVLSIRRAFARDHENLAIRRRRDVVDEACINFDRVSQFWIRRIGNVIDKEAIGNRRVVGDSCR